MEPGVNLEGYERIGSVSIQVYLEVKCGSAGEPSTRGLLQVPDGADRLPPKDVDSVMEPEVNRQGYGRIGSVSS